MQIAHHGTPRRAPKPGLLAFLGPGLIAGTSDDDSNGIATYWQLGAQFGYSMSWVTLFTYPLMATIQGVSAGIRRVSALEVNHRGAPAS